MKKLPSRRGSKRKKEPTSWGPVALWYDTHLAGEDTYHQKVILPNILRLVDPHPGETILDIACGQGYFSGALLEKGAIVIGTDISPELISLAQKKLQQGNFFVANSEDLSALHSQSVHKVLVVLAAQNIQRFDETLIEAGRILKKGGTITVVLNHPSFRIPKKSSWGIDQETQTQYRRIDGYLSESKVGIAMHPGDPHSLRTVSFHRPLQWYIKHFSKNSLFVDRLEEWTSHKTSTGRHAKMENAARKEFPLFLALRGVKNP